MLDAQLGVLPGGGTDVGPGGGVVFGGVADFVGDVAQAAVEREVAAVEQVAHRCPEIVAGGVPLPVPERIGVPAAGAQLVAEHAQINLVVGREAVGGKPAQGDQVGLGKRVVGPALGGVRNQQQRVVAVVARTRSKVGVLLPQGFDELAFERIEPGIGAGGGGGFIGLGAAGEGQRQGPEGQVAKFHGWELVYMKTLVVGNVRHAERSAASLPQ